MVTLTGTFTRLDGTPATGTVRVTPSRSPIMDSAGKIVISGPQVFPLDQDGKLTTEIPASNDPDLGPAFTYAVDVNLTHASWKISKVWIPHGSSTVDLSEIADYTPTPGVATRVVTIPADGTDGQVLVWDGAGFTWDFPPEGPQGPPGEVTTAALTSALAGKVTGTGMTLRRDTSVGTRVFLDHPGGSTMLHGDTGWRDIATLLPTGVTPSGNIGEARMKRVNDRVYVELKVDVGDTYTGPIVLTLPQGFGPVGYRYLPVAFVADGVGKTASAHSPFPHIGYATNQDGNPVVQTPNAHQFSQNSTVIWAFDYDCPGPWPTTLPGLPV